jgi:lysophospholipase L1-like esterase
MYNGDSITQGISIAGVGGKIGYAKTVNQLLYFGEVDNFAVGGTRLAHVDGESYALVDRLNDMSTDADVVFIMANTNDYASQVPIGDADSTDISTYNGALNTLFTWLKNNYKQQPIIISTMLTRKINYDPVSGDPLPISIEQYAQAVRDRVSDYHFILYDAYSWSGLDLRTSATDGTGITNDGLHPNQYGAELLGRKIASFINGQ